MYTFKKFTTDDWNITNFVHVSMTVDENYPHPWVIHIRGTSLQMVKIFDYKHDAKMCLSKLLKCNDISIDYVTSLGFVQKLS